MSSSPTNLTVVDRSCISPPPRSVPPATLPLTFFDIPWLLFPPAQPLFFYPFPATIHHFTHAILPNLNHALSLTLRHFFPLAGKLDASSPPTLQYSDGDSVSVTVAEATAAWAGEFHNLCGNQLRVSGDFHCLVPVLRSTGIRVPVLAVQFTVFPGAGICVGFALRHVAADQRTFNNFLKTWASFAAGTDNSSADQVLVAFHDRSVIRDPAGGLAQAFLHEWWSVVKTSIKPAAGAKIGVTNLSPYDPTTLATFVITPKEMDRIKQWILNRSESLFGSSTRILLSPYVLTCAFVWTCWIGTRFFQDDHGSKTTHYLGFIAGGISRLGFAVPVNYVGNCVGFGRASMTRRELLGENGIMYAAKSIGDTIEGLNENILGGSKDWISEWKAIRESDAHVMVTGSPKVDLYGQDFGFGQPAKIEEVSIDRTGAISLCEGREVIGSIEIGVAMPKSEMESFTSLFRKGLAQLEFN